MKAFVVAREGTALDASGLERHCRENLAPCKVPREFVLTEALPKTALDEIDQIQLS